MFVEWFSVFWEVEFTNLPFNFFGESAPQALVFGSHVQRVCLRASKGFFYVVLLFLEGSVEFGRAVFFEYAKGTE